MNAHPAIGAGPIESQPIVGVEWRVSWRRVGWASTTDTKSRTFNLRPAAERFIAKLHGDGRPDLTPVVFVRVDVRAVGRWTNHHPGDAT